MLSKNLFLLKASMVPILFAGMLTLFLFLPSNAIEASDIDLSVTRATSSSVSLKWSATNSSSIRFYSINYGASPTALTSSQYAGNLTSANVTGLVSGTTYYFQVWASSTQGTLRSQIVSAKTTGSPPSPDPPSEPISLSASASSSTRIDLQWTTDNSNHSGFKIERSLSGGSFQEIATVSASARSFANTKLSEGTTYYYRIYAYNSAGKSDYSNTASASTPISIPAAPSNLTATAVSSFQINIQWNDNSSNETGFKVERATSSSGPFTEIAVVEADVRAYSNTGLSENATYYYRVRAFNSAGNSSYSNTASATTQVSLPNAPSNLTATAVSTSRIDLQWTDNSTNETGFRVERASSSSGPFQLIATLGANTTTFSNTNLSENTTYYYRVRAYNSAGNSAYSNIASAQTGGTSPTSPTNLSASATSSSQISITWTDNSSNEAGFKIERSLYAGTGFTQIATVGANVTQYHNSNLNEATTYYYRVRAYNSSGDSAYSNVASATTKLNPPTHLQAVPVSPTQIDLTWKDNSNAESQYAVERNTSSINGPWDVIAQLSANSTNYSDISCEQETKYYYRVIAIGSVSEPSNVTSAITPSQPTDSTEPKWIGKTPVIGESYDVAITDSFAYVTSSTGLQIVDIRNPEAIKITSMVDLESANRVTTDGGGYLIASNSRTLKVIEVFDPYDPIIVGEIEMPDLTFGLKWIGNRVYAASYLNGLVIIDVSNVFSPKIISQLDTPGQANALDIEGNHVWIADGTAGVISIDISNAASPKIVGTLPTSSAANDIAVRNGIAYVSARNAGMLVVDILNPSSPQVIGVGDKTLFGSAAGVILRDQYALVASSSNATTDNGMQVFDISSPANPKQVAFQPVFGRSRGGIAIEDDIVGFASGWSGLTTINVTNMLSPRIMDHLPQVSQSRAIAANDSYLFATAYSPTQSLLYVYDMNNPAKPRNVGKMKLNWPYDIAIDNMYAYVADTRSIRVLEISDPANPFEIASVQLPDYVFGLSVSGDKIYAATYLAGLSVVDIRNPASPKLLGSVATPGQANNVDVKNGIAFVADGTSGVTVVDATNPASPRIIGSYSTTDRVFDIKVDGNHVFAAAARQGLVVLDISAPASPKLTAIGATQQFGLLTGVSISGNYVFAASNSSSWPANGMQIFDISDIDNIFEKAFLVSQGRQTYAVTTMRGKYALITDNHYLVNVAEF